MLCEPCRRNSKKVWWGCFLFFCRSLMQSSTKRGNENRLMASSWGCFWPCCKVTDWFRWTLTNTFTAWYKPTWTLNLSKSDTDFYNVFKPAFIDFPSHLGEAETSNKLKLLSVVSTQLLIYTSSWYRATLAFFWSCICVHPINESQMFSISHSLILFFNSVFSLHQLRLTSGLLAAKSSFTKLVANFVCLLFGADWAGDFWAIHWKQLHLQTTLRTVRVTQNGHITGHKNQNNHELKDTIKLHRAEWNCD